MRNFLALIFFSAVVIGCGDSAPPKVDSGKKWISGSVTNKFGETNSYLGLDGKDTKFTYWTDGVKYLQIEQKGFIDCSDGSFIKIKIDESPIREVYLNTAVDCKALILNEKNNEKRALIKEILSAKKIVIQLNPNGAYPGKSELIEIQQ